MSKQNRKPGDMDDRPMSLKEMEEMIKRLESRDNDMDPIPSDEKLEVQQVSK